MCGIIGYVGTDEVVPVLLDGLRRLEYRGYDSAGIAVMGADGIGILRAAGKLHNLEQRAYHEPLHGTVGVGHTRWATHGAPTETNAHPQTDSAGAVAVVHNGILENYSSLRRELLAAGVELESDTDTELIAQLLGREDGPLSERVLKVVPRLEGQYAVVAVHHEEPDVVVAFRKGPPLVVGVGDGETLVASDVTALLHRTRRVIYLLNGDVAVIRRDGVRILDAAGSELARPEETLDWDAGRVEKGGYRHFMLKEIFEQPDAIRNTVLAYLDQERCGVNLDGLGFAPEDFSKLRRVHLVACGTSWHACLVGKFVIEELTGLPTEVDYASEYRYRAPLIGEDVLVVGVTQSGETADTLGAMELARDGGAMLATVCNVRGSSSWRLATSRMLTQAGPEIGVASTKAFTTQLVAMVLMALALRAAHGRADETDCELVGELQFTQQASNGAELWWMGADGSQREALVGADTELQEPETAVITADGKILLFRGRIGVDSELAQTMAEAEPFDLFALDLKSGEPRRLENTHNFKQAFAISPDGETIAYEYTNTETGTREIWTMDL